MDCPNITVALDEGGGIDPIQDGIGEDQDLLASELPTSGAVIGGPGHRNGECS